MLAVWYFSNWSLFSNVFGCRVLLSCWNWESWICLLLNSMTDVCRYPRWWSSVLDQQTGVDQHHEHWWGGEEPFILSGWPCSTAAHLSFLLQYPLPDQSHPLPFAASQCCEYLLLTLPTARWRHLSSSRSFRLMRCYSISPHSTLFVLLLLCLTLMSALLAGNYFGWADPQSM